MQNDVPLRGFTTHCLDMKQGFIKRSVNSFLFYIIKTFWKICMNILCFIIQEQPCTVGLLNGHSHIEFIVIYCVNFTQFPIPQNSDSCDQVKDFHNRLYFLNTCLYFVVLNKYWSYCRLMSSGQWKNDTELPTLPSFFQASLHVEGSPSDTFINLHVSKNLIFYIWYSKLTLSLKVYT